MIMSERIMFFHQLSVLNLTGFSEFEGHTSLAFDCGGFYRY